MKGGVPHGSDQVAQGSRLRPDLAVARFFGKTRHLHAVPQDGPAASSPSAISPAAGLSDPFVDLVDELLDRMDAEDKKLQQIIAGLRG